MGNDVLIAVSPAGTPASIVDVSVTNSFGTSPQSLTDRFVYTPLPTITAVAPPTGAPSGGTTVTITGANLSHASGVSFGTQEAASFQVSSDGSITAVSPSGTQGQAVDITVTTPNGISQATSADQFTYLFLPVVASVTATETGTNTGPAAGGNIVTINGSNFTSQPTVTLVTPSGPTNAPAAVNGDGTQITVAPMVSGTPGSLVDVTVSTAAGVSQQSSADQYVYECNNVTLTPTLAEIPTTQALTSFPCANAPNLIVDSISANPGATTSTPGTVSFNPGNYSLTYNPAPHFHGTATVTYHAAAPGNPTGQIVVGAIADTITCLWNFSQEGSIHTPPDPPPDWEDRTYGWGTGTHTPSGSNFDCNYPGNSPNNTDWQVVTSSPPVVISPGAPGGSYPEVCQAISKTNSNLKCDNDPKDWAKGSSVAGAYVESFTATSIEVRIFTHSNQSSGGSHSDSINGWVEFQLTR